MREREDRQGPRPLGPVKATLMVVVTLALLVIIVTMIL